MLWSHGSPPVRFCAWNDRPWNDASDYRSGRSDARERGRQPRRFRARPIDRAAPSGVRAVARRHRVQMAAVCSAEAEARDGSGGERELAIERPIRRISRNATALGAGDPDPTFDVDGQPVGDAPLHGDERPRLLQPAVRAQPVHPNGGGARCRSGRGLCRPARGPMPFESATPLQSSVACPCASMRQSSPGSARTGSSAGSRRRCGPSSR
jgi:hypothetical protein